MKDNQWSYEDIAKLGDFKTGKVIESTISRGLPSFAKLSVVIHELNKSKEKKADPNKALDGHAA
jgi:hypothetical protein